MRRIASIAAAVLLVTCGIVLASPGLASAASSCTSGSDFLLSPEVGDGFAAVPTVGSGTFQADCDLGYGNSSTAVQLLQLSLNACYGYSLTVDGIYGSLTQAAVEYVQSITGISVDGIYGPQTRNAMKWRPTEGSGCAKLKQPLTKA